MTETGLSNVEDMTRFAAELRRFADAVALMRSMGAAITFPKSLRDAVALLYSVVESSQDGIAATQPKPPLAAEPRSPLVEVPEGTRRQPITEIILSVFQTGEILTPGDVAERLEGRGLSVGRTQVSNNLSTWTERGHLERITKGHYRLASADTGSAENPWLAHGRKEEDDEPPSQGKVQESG